MSQKPMPPFIWRVLAAGVVFLPGFLVSTRVQALLHSPKLEGVSETASQELSGFAFVYVVMISPILLGALIHSVVLLFLPSRLSTVQRRAANILLAAVVPAAVILLKLPGSILLSDLWPSTVVATLLYGVVCTVRESGSL